MSTADEESLLGVVEPQEMPLPGMPEPPADRDGTPYEDARNKVVQALGLTQERLRQLRGQRDEINVEIKQLVSDEELLERMTRVRRAKRD